MYKRETEWNTDTAALSPPQSRDAGRRFAQICRIPWVQSSLTAEVLHVSLFDDENAQDYLLFFTHMQTLLELLNNEILTIYWQFHTSL
jgi:hypothetical protein